MAEQFNENFENVNENVRDFIFTVSKYVDGWFSNDMGELIVFKKENVYINLDGVKSKKDMIMKALHYLSRDAAKSNSSYVRSHIISILNDYIGLDYGKDEYETIYKYLGNGINPKMTSEFIDRKFDMNFLNPEVLL